METQHFRSTNWDGSLAHRPVSHGVVPTGQRKPSHIFPRLRLMYTGKELREPRDPYHIDILFHLSHASNTDPFGTEVVVLQPFNKACNYTYSVVKRCSS